jgi:hypothetical protein
MATRDNTRTTDQNEMARDANKRSVDRETHPIEALPDEYGDVAEIKTEKYPDDSAAHRGEATGPSGQGGASPKSRPDYQDQFPENPPPSDTAKAWGEKVREVGSVQAASDAIAEAAKAGGGDGPNKGTGTGTSSAPKNS